MPTSSREDFVNGLLGPTLRLRCPGSVFLRSPQPGQPTRRRVRPKAFGLEGTRGKRPVLGRAERMLDQRAIAQFVWRFAEGERAHDAKDPVARAKGEAANKFNVSDETVSRAWKRFGKAERELHQR